jgi:hypothetical protein
MKTRHMIFLAGIAFCQSGLTQTPAHNDIEGYVALMRSDVQAKKVDIIRQNLTLTEEQAKKFWPLQRSYANELATLADERVNVIREYAQNWETLSDSSAKDLGTRMLDYQRKRVDLRKKYFDRIGKDVNATIAAKFFQIEMTLEDLIDLGISSSVPLVK